MNNNNILNDIKKMLIGTTDNYDHFDKDIVILINSAFSTLYQIGAGPKDGFTINSDDHSEVWSNFSENDNLIDLCIPYIYLKVRLVFDPPQNSFVVESYKDQIKEYESRISYLVDHENTFKKENQ